MKHLNHFVFSLLCLLLSANYLKAQDTSWYNEGRTIFTLTTAEQIIGLRDLVNSGTSFAGKIIKIGNDIDLSSSNWSIPIGTSSNHFDGTFDGCRQMITFNSSGVISSSLIGLFGYAGTNSLITRLVVAGTINITVGDCIIGSIVSLSEGQLSDCKSLVNINVSARYDLSVGGICGEAYLVSSCVNEGSISASSTNSLGHLHAGGICGELNYCIIQCENLKDISLISSDRLGTAYVGGLVGIAQGSNTLISYCKNTGKCSAKAGGYGAASAGGVCGLSSSTVLSIDNSYVACSSLTSDGYSGYPGPGPIIGRVLNGKTLSINGCFANNDIVYNKTNSTAQLVDKSFSLKQMFTIDFCNKMNENNLYWVGGEGVLPIVFGSMSETGSYTTYNNPAAILFDTEMVDIPIGTRMKLNADVLPIGAYNKLSWVSSDPNVITVDDDGVLWSLEAGDAVITATSLRDNTISATCDVHVGTKDLCSIIIPESLVLKIKESIKIEQTLVPSYATYNLTWQSTNEQIATVDQDGNVTSTTPGETTIIVTDNLTNVQASCNVSVIMEVGDTFKADIESGSNNVSTTFMLTDLENRYVSIGDGTNAAIATATTGSIVIPESIVGPGNLTYTVTSVGNKAFASSNISSVTIPQGISNIGDNAFNGCSNLTSVTVEWSEPLTINSTCFSNASNAMLNVPKGCYEAYSAAENWRNFKSIVEPPHIVGDLFNASVTAGSGQTDMCFKVIDAENKYVSVGNGEEAAIPDYTSGKVVLPSTVKGYDGQTYKVKQISDAAFFDCYEVTSFQLPSDITTIGRLVFYDCAGLTSFTIPTSVTTIGEEAFNNCYNLTSINIPSSVTSLGTSAFYGCSKLTTVTVKWIDPVEIDAECFTNVANATLNIPKGSYENYATADNWKNFKTIKEPAHSVGDTFRASIIAGGTKVDATFKVTNTSNKNVSIGDGEDAAIDIFASGNINIPSTVNGYDGQTYTVKTVADAAFFGCENITSISLPSSITEIGNSAFLRCYNLANITIPTNVTRIGNEAFFYCEKLASISIPKNVTSIGTNAFKNCNMLTSVTAGRNTPIAIDSECFSNAANATLIVPYGAKERYEAATGWNLFKNIVEMAPKDGDMFTALTAEGVKMTFVVISASDKTCQVESVPSDAEGLVTIPTTANDFTVTKISSYAFYHRSQITATEIPTSIKSIGTDAFSGCNNLTSVTVGWDQPIAISSNVFSNAANATLYVPIGTNYDYSIATGWKDFGQIANKTESTLFADDVIVCRGGQITLPIELSNKENIRSLQFELALPSGVSVVTDGLGNPMAALSERANSTHKITGTPLANGNYQFNILSKNYSDDIIQGTEGLIASIKLKVWKHVTPQDYVIKITDSELTIDNGESIGVLLQDTHSKLTVSSVLLGDVKDDKRVSVTDISNVIDYLLHKQVTNFVFHAADVNGDGRISVSDISTMIDILLHKTVFGEEQGTKIEDLDPQ